MSITRQSVGVDTWTIYIARMGVLGPESMDSTNAGSLFLGAL